MAAAVVAAGGGFFAGGGGSALNSSDDAALAAANSSVITDLAKLGPAGTKFTHDFFVPGTLITFPSQAVSTVANVKGVTSAVGALSLDALHETGTVPKITASVKTGGRDDLGLGQAPRSHGGRAGRPNARAFRTSSPSNWAPPRRRFRPPAAAAEVASAVAAAAIPLRRRRESSAFAKCLSPAQKAYEQNVVIPERTVNEVLNPPTTNTSTSTYTVAGVTPRTRRRVWSPRRSW